MEKKKYSKPVVVAERFEPQEYCEVCVRPDNKMSFTTGHAYADFSGDGYCQADESVSTNGQTPYSPDGKYSIDIYQFQSWKLGWSESLGFGNPINHKYGSEWWELAIRYGLHKVSGSYKVIVMSGQIYNNHS